MGSDLSKSIGLGAAIAMLMSCGSCSENFLIKSSGFGANVHLTFYENKWMVPSPKARCISELTVEQEEWPNGASGIATWQIEAINGCAKIKTIDVGMSLADLERQLTGSL